MSDLSTTHGIRINAALTASLLETHEMREHAKTALEYGNQAHAVLGLWLAGLTPDDIAESSRVAAVHNLLSEALAHLKMAVGVNHFA
ncbi:hypothetical protein [Rahnella sp. ChDrAdgB13]|uniref:hypothetical protein n=1 Tax=Rahnella sp. ChDrAdgB13 TaxID=1850581 RepID=UPI001FCAB06E|nr:hypothetical protein [Rahnella sp. ChDrAdgB13]